ncbi:hypothetical protein QFW77_14545 [Luteimonas sp. RD2P54]|uniref:Uncharacterized protein n=1 Tax=Luteimonas endophytica TaxID=3042023 RepID=A0ABT6JC52_9GAMM|nr:hypothetical protein [Luteimonas endophytica]MDH5824197.1 hypothetical protein [Luteimonas endophytica]
MQIRNTTPASCFGLAGCDENAGTAALGWCLSHVPALRREVLQALGCNPALDVVVASQVFAEDRGFTDLELTSGTTLHAIFEAKLGWLVPTLGQLERYVPRLLKSPTQAKALVSVSAADQQWARRHLPTDLAGVPVAHFSWSDLQAMAHRALDNTRSPVDRTWLTQLSYHLQEYVMTSNVFDSRAYVVSLARSRVQPSDPLTWIDVVVKQGKYFHPVGGSGRSGWPVIPPSYIGFRYLSEFRSVHFIEHVDVTDHLQNVDPRWPTTNSPHFVYTLGPAMVPALPLGLGTIYPNMRNWVALDLLLSGIAKDYKDAIDRMRKRVQQQGG